MAQHLNVSELLSKAAAPLELLGAQEPSFVRYAAIAIAIAIAVALLLVHLVRDSGVLLPVKVQRNQVLGPFLIVYQDVVGPYMHAGRIMCSVVKKVEHMGLVHSSQTSKVPMVGVYFDDPALVPSHQLRHSLGAVYKMGADLATPEQVERHRKFLELLSPVKHGELKVGYIPASRCLAASFPFRSALSMITSILKGYPRLQRELKGDIKAGKASHEVTVVLGSLEVYLPHEKRMWISFPLTPRQELKPFDPATTLVHHYTGKRAGKGKAGGAAPPAAGKKQE